jgi:choline dehydrogenase-like flavoprotein
MLTLGLVACADSLEEAGYPLTVSPHLHMVGNDHRGHRDLYDVVVVGSGFGGAMAAKVLVDAGWYVLMIERGDWVRRGVWGWSREPTAGRMTRHYDSSALAGVTGPEAAGAFRCVGGPSVFFGGVTLRFRETDFFDDRALAGEASWPFSYADIEPHYARVEALLGVAGRGGEDPSEPWRSGEFPHAPMPLSRASQRLADAARSLGLHPFRLPMAINHNALADRGTCVACGHCDGFACPSRAKGDIATAVLPNLLEQGMGLRTRMVVTGLRMDGSRVEAVECRDAVSGERHVFRGRVVLLAAGALASPQILLASGLQQLNPGGFTVGRYLTRHYNEVILGLFPSRGACDRGGLHKQIGVHDLYDGDQRSPELRGRVGGLQEFATAPLSLVREELPPALGPIAEPLVGRLTGLLVIAEDQPRAENRITIDPGISDRYGVPRLTVKHSYSERDLAAGRVLVKLGRRILRRAGALALRRHRITTMSHALGTVRMGVDPSTSALDDTCRFRGTDNLFVVDGSALPRSAAVNPSLTIAANALRAATAIAAAEVPGVTELKAA